MLTQNCSKLPSPTKRSVQRSCSHSATLPTISSLQLYSRRRNCSCRPRGGRAGGRRACPTGVGMTPPLPTLPAPKKGNPAPAGRPRRNATSRSTTSRRHWPWLADSAAAQRLNISATTVAGAGQAAAQRRPLARLDAMGGGCSGPVGILMMLQRRRRRRRGRGRPGPWRTAAPNYCLR